MNIWRRGALHKNPYYRTAFRLARVPRETVQYATIVKILGQTRKVVGADSQAHRIKGEPVARTDINAAEQILLDPKQRIAEELLHHATESLPLHVIKKLSAEAARYLAVEDASGLTAINPHSLVPLAQALVQRYLSSVPEPLPHFGALELDLVPPFGSAEED